MRIRLIKGTSNVGKELLEIYTEHVKVVVGFGEELATGEIAEKINPMIEGLTNGNPNYDGIFLLRNPENSNIVNFALKTIPIFMERKLKNNFEICTDFFKLPKKNNIIQMADGERFRIKDLEITPYLIDSSNFNTYILKFKDSQGKQIIVSGDFRGYNEKYCKDRLNKALLSMGKVDGWIIDGKNIGKYGVKYSSEKDVINKLRNIVKYYTQAFVIQSPTDMITTCNMYATSQKTGRIFIEETFLSNLTSAANGSAPTPLTSKKVYSYTPLMLGNESFEFKRKYTNPFYGNNVGNKIYKEKIIMNINKEMLQDIQLMEKEGGLDACIIFAEENENIKNDPELEEFINMLKNTGMDYYELLSYGMIDDKLINKIMSKLGVRCLIPIDCTGDSNDVKLDNFMKIGTGKELQI